MSTSIDYEHALAMIRSASDHIDRDTVLLKIQDEDPDLYEVVMEDW